MLTIEPVAIAHTPFKEKFGIPRQPALANEVIGEIRLLAPYNEPRALNGLEQISHVWLQFLFHKIRPEQCQQLTVRPPRLGGNKKLGVFATRSTHRPNRLGQSVVRIKSLEGSSIFVQGLDLLDQTPIIDIKPYLPYADCIQDATNGIAMAPPVTLAVQWIPRALEQLRQHYLPTGQHFDQLKMAIEQCLAQDPRPAYQAAEPERLYGMNFYHLNVRWRYPQTDSIEVVSVSEFSSSENE